MAMTNNDIKSRSVKEFLSNDKYVIPIYQRNYDWGEREALQLIEDIADYAKEHNNRNYYIGSAIVFPKSNDGEFIFETIDGQQRLTTLTILTSLLCGEGYAEWYQRPNLTYDHRKEADIALKMLENKQCSEHPAAQNIVNVYNIFKKNLPQILKTKRLEVSEFAKYLFNNVMVVRIPVPEDTELNHYFEIMNTRGEQLEKHEVLKAELMGYLDETEHLLFNTIWEACSDMTSYVQMNFTANCRKVIFSENLEDIQDEDFNVLNNHYTNNDSKTEEKNADQPLSIEELINHATQNIRYDLPKDGSQNEGEQDRFGSIINFPNFLLHVLKIMYHCRHDRLSSVDEYIKLDDKRLIPIFQYVIGSFADDILKRAFVKQFIMTLLQLRLKFDRYIIKREYLNGNERWSIKNIKSYKSGINYVNTFNGTDEDEEDTEIGKDIRMLEAMFHVSAPTQIYKHWLNAVLYYVYDKPTVTASQLKDMLYLLATTYMRDVYLTNEKIDFETIIYKNEFKAQNDSIKNWELIDKGCDVPNFVFNFYDYVTWKEGHYPQFEFSYRTSVEHFYPRNPMPGYENLQGKGLDKFGNLCLISHGMNSKFSNNMPKAKLDNFGRIDEVKNGLSLKLLEMMAMVDNEGEWGVAEIDTFEKMATEKLKRAIIHKV